MKEITLTITDKDGLHARPASDLCKEVSKLDEKIELLYKNRTVNMKSTLAIMSLAIPKNSEITIKVTGEKEDTVADNIVSLFKNLKLTD
jgi:phosphocarrier protein